MTVPPPTVPSPLRVAIDPCLRPSLAEVRYTLGTIASIAGFALDLHLYGENGTDDDSVDVYYGPRPDVAATVSIASVPWAFTSHEDRVPAAVTEPLGVPALTFAGGPAGPVHRAGGLLKVGTDVVFSSFWLLTGSEERGFERDRWDNLSVGASALVRHDLLARPPVSLLSTALRDVLDPRGDRAIPWPWSKGSRAGAALTHDVDYPEIIRWIEVARLLTGRRPGRARLARDVVTGRSHFWQFEPWIDLAAELGGRPAFYFMARRGSLVRFALGTPDAFYDIGAPRFRELFVRLADAGCEVGLHASFHAHRSAARLEAERLDLERACGAEVHGNRHHYWHLDPEAPDETLRRHAEAGFRYDSSLAFETHPGFRRGVCHPFRPWHRATRRAVDCVQLPPAWMDDHFHRRRAANGITDPDAEAERLVSAVEQTGGILVLDYHPRGMNPDFFPEYGPWLERFARRRLTTGLDWRTPVEIARAFEERESLLAKRSVDRTPTVGAA